MPAEPALCPHCEHAGEAGTPCPERSCARHGYHHVPVRWLEAQPDCPEAEQIHVGRTIDGHVLAGFLGAGAFGKVWLALQLPLLMPVALKQFLPRSGQNDPRLLGKFRDEAATLAELQHPNIVRLVRWGETPAGPYLAMEYVPGGRTLRHEVRQRAARGEGMPLPLIRHLMAQLLAALECAHGHRKVIVHRDLKPDNLMLQSVAGDPHHLKVVDFGLAKQVEDDTATSLAIGTPAYMAPEQLQARHIGPWTDLYAVGVMAHEMLTGKRPFDGTTEEMLAAKRRPDFDVLTAVRGLDLPPDVLEFFSRALAHDHRARYPDVAAFRGGLDLALRALEGQGTPAAEPLQGLLDTSELLALRREKAELEARARRAEQEAKDLRQAASPAHRAAQDPTLAVQPADRGGKSSLSRGELAGHSTAAEPLPTLQRPAPRRSARLRVALALVGVLTLGLTAWWALGRAPAGSGKPLEQQVIAAPVPSVAAPVVAVPTGPQPPCAGQTPTGCLQQASVDFAAGRSLQAAVRLFVAGETDPVVRDLYAQTLGRPPMREDLGCEAFAGPCDDLDFWTADQARFDGQSWGERAPLMALTTRCEAGSGRACLLGTLVALRRDDRRQAHALAEKGCGLGEVGACREWSRFWADTYQAEFPASKARARQLAEAACKDGDGEGCALLFATLEAKTDEDRAAQRRWAAEACRLGVPAGCTFATDGTRPEPSALAEAVRLLRLRCDGGRPSDCRMLADLVTKGEAGQPADPVAGKALHDKGARWLQQACQDGRSGPACVQASYRSLEAKDPAEALRLAQRACELGAARGCWIAGYLLSGARGLTANPAAALQAYRRSCQLGGDCGSLAYALSERQGDATPEDVDLFSLHCANRDPQACDGLSQLGAAARSRVHKAIVASAEQQEFAAHTARCQNGSPSHCTWAAYMRLKGDGTARDVDGAIAELNRLCAVDEWLACAFLVDVHGERGPRKDPVLVGKFQARVCALYPGHDSCKPKQ